MSWRLFGVCVLLGMACLPEVRAESVIFRWIDAQGGWHISDSLGDVPEPYHTLYRKKLEALKEKGADGKSSSAQRSRPKSRAAPQAANPKGRQPSMVEQQIAARKRWKTLMVNWRTRLANATAAYGRAKERFEQASMNPILRETPKGKADMEAAREAMDRELATVEQARKMLLETLPKQAKAERVPPKWLE